MCCSNQPDNQSPSEPASNAPVMAFSDIMADSAIYVLLQAFASKLPNGWGVELFYRDGSLEISVIDPNDEYIEKDGSFPEINLFKSITTFVNQKSLEIKE